MNLVISLDNLRFIAHHGVLPHEREYGNVFIVNLEVNLPYHLQTDADNLDNTVSYADLFQIVKEEMDIPAQLMETVACRIISKIKKDYPLIMSGKVSIRKEHPPIPGCDGSATISISF